MAAVKRGRPLRRPNRPARALSRRGGVPDESYAGPSPLMWAAGIAVALGLAGLAIDESLRFDPDSALAASAARREAIAERLAAQEKRRTELLNVKRLVSDPPRRRNCSPSRSAFLAGGSAQDLSAFLNSSETAVDGWGGWLEPTYVSVEHKLREADKYLERNRAEIAETLREIDREEAELAAVRTRTAKRESLLRRLLKGLFGSKEER